MARCCPSPTGEGPLLHEGDGVLEPIRVRPPQAAPHARAHDLDVVITEEGRVVERVAIEVACDDVDGAASHVDAVEPVVPSLHLKTAAGRDLQVDERAARAFSRAGGSRLGLDVRGEVIVAIAIEIAVRQEGRGDVRQRHGAWRALPGARGEKLLHWDCDPGILARQL